MPTGSALAWTAAIGRNTWLSAWSSRPEASGEHAGQKSWKWAWLGWPVKRSSWKPGRCPGSSTISLALWRSRTSQQRSAPLGRLKTRHKRQAPPRWSSLVLLNAALWSEGSHPWYMRIGKSQTWWTCHMRAKSFVGADAAVPMTSCWLSCQTASWNFQGQHCSWRYLLPFCAHRWELHQLCTGCFEHFGCVCAAFGSVISVMAFGRRGPGCQLVKPGAFQLPDQNAIWFELPAPSARTASGWWLANHDPHQPWLFRAVKSGPGQASLPCRCQKTFKLKTAAEAWARNAEK